ncbi:MAG: ATP synthase F1 subunit gamma [Treponema sp.]|nr:ATP synthase F1 subunit gamma [Treponema sp.]
MANQRDIRLRMKAIGQTLQVTKAMNLISTSKLRKGRRVLEDTEPFFVRIQKTMYDILAGAGNVKSRYLNSYTEKASNANGKSGFVEYPSKRSAILVVTSDKGLAGGYNANVFREVTSFCKGLPNAVLILIGAIGYRYFIHSKYLIMENFSFRSHLPNMDNAREIAEFVIAQYLWGMFDEVYIVYTHMYSAVKLLPEVKQLLPLDKRMLQEDIVKHGLEKRVELHFEYDPSEEAVFDSLVPMYIKGVIYGCLIEAYASEQSARMAAMDEASKSAQDMLTSLHLKYNRIRQASITQEMTEIISGSSALS